MKKCRGYCGEEKALEEFTRNKRSADGRHPYCRRCKSLYDMENRRKTKEIKRQKKRNFEKYGIAVADEHLETRLTMQQREGE